MIGCIGPAPDHAIPKTGDKGGQNTMASGDLEESARAFGLAQNFRFDFVDERLPSLGPREIGLLLKIPQIISHLAEFFVVVRVC